MREVLQAARADAVRSLLIFLHLLECEPERIAELLLGHSENHPAHPDTAAHMLIDKVEGLIDHCLFHDFIDVWRRQLRRKGSPNLEELASRVGDHGLAAASCLHAS
jgi:hypothetical protein